MNVCTFIGNLVSDIELENIPNSENVVATGSIAVNDFKSSKEKDTDFIRFKVYGNDRATFLSENAGKGNMISISGVLKIRQYEDKERVKKEYSFIRVDSYKIITWKKDKEGNIFDSAEVVLPN